MTYFYSCCQHCEHTTDHDEPHDTPCNHGCNDHEAEAYWSAIEGADD